MNAHLSKTKYHEIILACLIQIPGNSFGLSSSVSYACLFLSCQTPYSSVFIKLACSGIIDTWFEMYWWVMTNGSNVSADTKTVNTENFYSCTIKCCDSEWTGIVPISVAVVSPGTAIYFVLDCIPFLKTYFLNCN